MADKKQQSLKPRTRKRIRVWLRAAIQLGFFICMPTLFSTAFADVKKIVTRIGAGVHVGFDAFSLIFVLLIIFTIVFGRFFCGYACAFGSLGDAIRALYVNICKKLKKKPLSISGTLAGRFLPYLKYVILALIVFLCSMGVYTDVTHGLSPWDVFSRIHALNFNLEGYEIGIGVFVFILIGMLFEDRFFCRYLCPMGAIFSILPVLPPFALRRQRKNCAKNCNNCTRRCPSNISLPEAGSMEVRGDCFQCQKCIDACPKKNISCGLHRLKGNEEWFTVFRATLLALLVVLVESLA